MSDLTKQEQAIKASLGYATDLVEEAIAIIRGVLDITEDVKTRVSYRIALSNAEQALTCMIVGKRVVTRGRHG